jgi:hypothetical protein
MAREMMERLEATRVVRRERSLALWALSAAEREVAMRRGELTWGQLCEWAQKESAEVPLIDGEWTFIAAFTPEVAEAKRPKE